MKKVPSSEHKIPPEVCILLLFLAMVSPHVHAQISPPGLDGAKGVGWAAIGLNQQFGKRWYTVIYTGGSLQSDPTNYKFLRKPAIFVVNQETYYQFNKHWQAAVATSLRSQEFYNDDPPYSAKDPAWKNEVRYYARVFHRTQLSRWTVAASFRPELRTFYSTHWDQWSSSPRQLRFRWKVQGSCPLNQSKSNSVILADEVLVATDYQSASKSWNGVHFTENRLSTFFRHTFSKPALIVDAGLMHQFWRENGIHYTTYFAFDLIFQNPFG